MTYQEFTDLFLVQLAQQYNSQVPGFDLHSLVDVDLWKQVLPDSSGQYREGQADFDQLLWHQIKWNAFVLDGRASAETPSTLLLVFSVPQPSHAKEARLAGIRIDRTAHQVLYYTLRRPRYLDEAWEIYQYSFAEQKFLFEQKIWGGDTVREFRNNIERLPFVEKHSASIFSNIRSLATDIFSSIKEIARTEEGQLANSY